MRLTLIRHGHVEGIDPQRFRGRWDLPLTDLGERQAHATAKRLARLEKPAALYTSPQHRALRTASIIGQTIGLSPKEVPEFSDIDYGKWQGSTQEEVSKNFEFEIDLWNKFPHFSFIEDGETLHEVSARVNRTIGILLRRHWGEEVLLVGHDSVNKLAIMQALDLPLSQYWSIRLGPCSISKIDFGQGESLVSQVIVEVMNDAEHLEHLSHNE